MDWEELVEEADRKGAELARLLAEMDELRIEELEKLTTPTSANTCANAAQPE